MRQFTEIDAPQRSDNWFRARAGKLTGSRVAKALAKTNAGAWTSGRKNTLAELVLERITGKPQDQIVSTQAMRDGVEREPDAFALYEAVTGSVLLRSGFLLHTSYQAGVSLDGHVDGFTGIVEIKCPMAATHLEYLESGKVPGDYLKQIQHGLWITGAQWCDWLSYHPDFPEALQVKVVRVVRDEAAIREHEKQVLAFLAEVDAKEASVRTAMNVKATLESVA